MQQTVRFDYFYGGESEQFSYYRIPRLLVTGPQFKNLSTDAKLLYGLMLDRMSLSAKNGWYDHKGRVYIYYSMDEVMTDLNCGHDKAIKLLADLDTSKGIGLIERVKQGQGKPTIIYVKQFTSRAIPSPVTDDPSADECRSLDFGFSEVRTSEKPNSGFRKIRSQDIEKSEVSLYNNYPYINYLDGRTKVKREAQKKAAESSKQAAKKSAEWSQKAGKAIVRTVKSVVSYIANTFGIIGIIVILLAIILIGIIMASPLGILFSNEPAPNAVPLSSAVAQINMELNRRLNTLQSGDYTSVEITGSPPSWIEVVTVFASHTAGAEGGVDVASLTPDRVSRLKTVFWQMCYITSSTQTVEIPDSNPDDEIDDSRTETHLTISIIKKTADEMRVVYGFTDFQNEALDTLLSPGVNLAQLISSVTIDDAAALELLESLPANLSPERRAVVQQALSLVGKVNYFWGGKSLVLGWDSRWGQLTKVSAAGSPTTGTYRPFGLDCSGFVDWVFYNTSGGSYVIGRGGGAGSQHRNCAQISWGSVQPGDLVFYPGDDHIGIVGGKSETGHWLIIHCASGRNNVVITDASGFITAGRPYYYNE